MHVSQHVSIVRSPATECIFSYVCYEVPQHLLTLENTYILIGTESTTDFHCAFCIDRIQSKAAVLLSRRSRKISTLIPVLQVGKSILGQRKLPA